MRRPEFAVTEGGADVFADLGFAEPEEEPAKARLAALIRKAVARRRLTRARAAAPTGLEQPEVSALSNGRPGGFSSGRLMLCLTALGQDLEIVVRRRIGAGGRGGLRVVETAA